LEQDVGLLYGLSGIVVESKAKADEVQGPMSLITVEFLSCYKVLKVLIVCPNFYWIDYFFKEMSPLFQGPDDSQYLFVMDLIILFH